MAKIKTRNTSISDNVNVPQFRFSSYDSSGRTIYCNNSEFIDFVTDGKSLYVCVVSSLTPSKANITEQEGLLKIVSQGPQGIQGKPGEDGAAGVNPKIDVNFEGDQLRVKVNGETKALSPSLTGPSWKPVLEDNILTWEATDDRYMPDSIDLANLRPIQKHPVLLRTNSDNTKRSDEASGPANFIQWKYEGDEYWTNLMSISELMNLALAGISIWQATDGKWHFGHREVVRANYISDKNGRKIISNVRLGDVLFDAGEIPVDISGPDYGMDIDLIYQKLEELELMMVKTVNHIGPDATGNVNVATGGSTPSLDGYATEAWVSSNYQPKGNYVTSVNGVAPQPGSNGAITIEVGDSSFDVKIENNKLYKTTGNGWVEVGSVGGGSGSGNIDPAEVESIIGRILEGLEIPDEYVRGSEHNYFIRKSDLSDYRTYNQILAMIQDAMTGNDLDYYRVFTLYQRTNSPTVPPNRPVVGVWEWDAQENVIALKPNASSEWVNHPENATPQAPYLWMTSATYSHRSRGEIGSSNATVSGGIYTYDSDYAWSNPICLTGEGGKEGEDGDGIEFVFHLGASQPTLNLLKAYKEGETTQTFNNATAANTWWALAESRDWLPGDGTTNGHWTDDPTGIDDTNADTKVEWACLRRSHYDSVNSVTVWEEFSSPFIWAMWGEDGVDGAGVEYIFRVAANDVVTNNQLNPSQWINLPTTAAQVTTLGASYQIDDWVPDGTTRGGYQMPDYNFTDNPSDVGPDQPYEFVSIRKKRINPLTGNSEWGPFSEPKLWGYYGTTTIQTTVYGSTNNKPYTCYAFTRTNNNIANYIVSYDFSVFGDANTTYSDLTDEQKGMFYENPLDYIKTTNNGQVVQIAWSDTVPAGTEQLWLITNHIGDEASITDSGWTSPQKWGDQAGLQIEYAVADEQTTDRVYNHENGYTLPNLGTLYNGVPKYETDDPAKDHDQDGIDESTWRDDVELAGMGVWGDENDIEDPDYMAICFKRANGVWTDWQISRIKGEKGDPGAQGDPGGPGQDGRDVEFIYYRTKSSSAPGIETAKYYKSGAKTGSYDQVDDALPKVSGITSSNQDAGYGGSEGKAYWHDHPAGVNETWTHEWVSTRRSYYTNGVKYWEAFYTPPTLWSKFGEDGKDGDGLEYVFWGLTEEQNTRLYSTWPTQKTSTNTNANVAPSRKDSANRSITDSEYLPAILLSPIVGHNPMQIEAVDDNPGITGTIKYVYASKRRYYGSTGTWGEFSEIHLWNSDNLDDLLNVVLDIEDDSHTIVVDSNQRVTDEYGEMTYNTDSLRLYKDFVLLSNGNIVIKNSSGSDVVVAEMNPDYNGNNNFYSLTNSQVTVTSNGVEAKVMCTRAYKYENSNTSSITLKVKFTKTSNQYPVLSAPFEIRVGVHDVTDTYCGYDILTLVPRNAKGRELKYVPYTQKTASRGATTYSEPLYFTFWGTPIFSTLDDVALTKYWFGYDNVAPVGFVIPSNNATLTQLKSQHDGVDQFSQDFYFDRYGTLLNNSTGAFFKITLNNTDYNDNAFPWTRWTSTAKVIISAFTATDSYPIDSLYFGIGLDDNNIGTNGITDEAIVHIIYPGVQGPKGDNGSYKKELYSLGDVNAQNATFQSAWKASPGATIATLTNGGWSATKPTVTSQYPHIWMTRADVTVGAESTEACIWEEPTRITPVDGNVEVQHTYQYLDQPVMRVTTWNASTKYYAGATRVNDSTNNPTGNETGTKYLDVVEYSPSTGDKRYYKCISNVTTTSNNPNPASDTTHWELFSAASDTAMANLLVSNSAFINSLSSHQIVVTDSDNTIVGGMTSSTGNNATIENRTIGDVRIWAGETSNNGSLEDAAFTVTNAGVVTSQGDATYGSNNTVGVKTVMDNGAITISTDTGTGGAYVPRATFGFNSSGELVLTFYDANGDPIYDLGPGGLKWSATVVNPSWDLIKCNIRSGSTVASHTDGDILETVNITWSSYGGSPTITGNTDGIWNYFLRPPDTIYQFIDGSLSLGAHTGNDLLYYINPLGTSPDLLDSHSSIHNKYFSQVYNLKDSSVHLENIVLPAGEYVIPVVNQQSGSVSPVADNTYSYGGHNPGLIRHVFNLLVLRSNGTTVTTSNAKAYIEEDISGTYASSGDRTYSAKLVWGDDPGTV